MSRTDTWMPLYVADYLADTRHLSGPEHGAYLLLMMHYWRTGPLPDDDAMLARIASTEPKAWRAMSGVVRSFFVADDGQLHHKRIDSERQKASAISAKRAAAGAAGAQQTNGKRVGKQAANAAANADDLPTICRTQSQEQIQEEGSLRSQRVREDVDPPGFAEWWSEYPRKDAKGDARKAYAKALKRSTPAELLTRLRLYPFQRDPKFVPMPATWINQGRWESAGEAPDTTRPLFSEAPSKTAYLEKYTKVA